MQILKKYEDLADYTDKKQLKRGITEEIMGAIGLVRKLIDSGFQNMKACVILTESKNETKEVYKDFGLSDLTVEFEEKITDEGDVWVKQVHILDDSGDGVIVFQKLDSCP